MDKRDKGRWSDFVWPEWVPAKLRENIESFWGESYGRGPREWEANAIAPYNGGAPLGTVVAKLVCASDRRIVRGRYVHCWNNIGCVVLADGTAVTVSGTPTQSEVERAELKDMASQYEGLGHG